MMNHLEPIMSAAWDLDARASRLSVRYALANTLTYPLILLVVLPQRAASMHIDRQRVYTQVSGRKGLLVKAAVPLALGVSVYVPSTPHGVILSPAMTFAETLELPLPVPYDNPHDPRLEAGDLALDEFRLVVGYLRARDVPYRVAVVDGIEVVGVGYADAIAHQRLVVSAALDVRSLRPAMRTGEPLRNQT